MWATPSYLNIWSHHRKLIMECSGDCQGLRCVVVQALEWIWIECCRWRCWHATLALQNFTSACVVAPIFSRGLGWKMLHNKPCNCCGPIRIYVMQGSYATRARTGWGRRIVQCGQTSFSWRCKAGAFPPDLGTMDRSQRRLLAEAAECWRSQP